MNILRWGQSAYETDASLKQEKSQLESLGCHIIQQQEFKALADTQALLVTSKSKVSGEIIAQLPKLEFILTTTSGYDHIDREAANNNGVLVGRCPIARRDAVVDTSIAMALSLIRNLPLLHQRAQRNIWARASLPQYSSKRIKDISIGIIGYGLIGKAAGRVWSDLGAKVRWHDPNRMGSMPLDELLSLSDVVSLHCSHTVSSHQIINQQTLQHMKPQSVLINTARGKCVDLVALQNAKHLGGYALDVFPEEPPEHLATLTDRPNSILLPHAAGYYDTLGDVLVQEVYDSVALWMEQKTLTHLV